MLKLIVARGVEKTRLNPTSPMLSSPSMGIDDDILRRLERTRAELDKVSPSFCLAKWLQVTIHLQNGFNHSCHHPDVHKIPLDELARNPSALHNTAFKKSLREKMLRGERPTECEFCWKVEDTPGDHHSDRVLKSSDPWAAPHLRKIARQRPDLDVNPTYVEVSFGYECNFKCNYCSPAISSSIYKQYAKLGPYAGQVSLEEIRAAGREPYREAEKNPYVEAFWKWFPELAPDLKVFRITGGEPLLNPNTMKVLDFIDANPLPDLQLAINSNFGTHARFYRTFIAKLQKLTAEKKLGDFTMYTSIDAHGARAEYMRVGLDYEAWLERARDYLRAVPWDLTFMVTFNALSVTSFRELLEDILKLNKEFLRADPITGLPRKRTLLDITHLMNPRHFSLLILDEATKKKVGALVKFMEKNRATKTRPWGFADYEIHKLRRINAWLGEKHWTDQQTAFYRRQFFLFTRQFLEREKKEFSDVFPEMRKLLALCRTEAVRQSFGFEPATNQNEADFDTPTRSSDRS